MHRRALLAGCLAAPVVARSEPKTVRVINAYGAGGTADLVCRLLFGRLSDRTGRTYVVENRPGAAGTIAATLVARAPADGSVLLYDATAHSVNPALFGPKLPYDTQRDFLPVFLSLVTPNTILAGNGFPVHSVAELIAAAKAAPGTVDAGSTGIGSAQHITLALFNVRAGVQINHVVYRDAPALRNDLVTGRIPLQLTNVPGSIAIFRSGTARVLAHSGLEPVSVLPGVPAIAGTLPGFETYEWNGVFLPSGAPEPLRHALNAALNAVAVEPEVSRRLEGLGGLLRPNTPEEFAEFLQRQFALNARVVHDAQIHVD